MGSLPRMTPLILPHVWLQFVGELLDHPVYMLLSATHFEDCS